MKLAHYDKFKCIADKCNITCCQEWKISIDDNTGKKWNRMHMQDKMCMKDEELVIQLNEKRKCPFLSERKLCNLVINHGTEMIPHACDVFPRQIHEFDDRTEYALVSCCPEVIRLLDETDIGEMTQALFAEKHDELYELRKLVIEILIKADNSSYGLLESFYMLSDIMEQGMGDYNDAFIKQLEDAIAAMPTDVMNTFEEVNELFLDVVDNYRRQGIYEEYLRKISAIADDISEDFDRKQILEKYALYQKKVAKYDILFRKYLISELFADGILPDSDITELSMMVQWFAMEYVVIRHAVFLKTVYQNKNVDFSDICEYMVIISRIMGYNKEDIYAYMEECFESIIWDWGYMALIVGKN